MKNLICLNQVEKPLLILKLNIFQGFIIPMIVILGTSFSLLRCIDQVRFKLGPFFYGFTYACFPKYSSRAIITS